MSNGKGSIQRRRQVSKEVYDRNHRRTFGARARRAGRATYVVKDGKLEKKEEPQESWIMGFDPAIGPDKTYVHVVDRLKGKILETYYVPRTDLEGDHDSAS